MPKNPWLVVIITPAGLETVRSYRDDAEAWRAVWKARCDGKQATLYQQIAFDIEGELVQIGRGEGDNRG